ncbi:hypothetical protein JIX56_19925 [Streptomyces sp. CA-210063]|uniref:hypothetical protein n=1 Tax=Streptomyces sp. CA-210063 TaxID=2801029 RepID=UPI00214B2DAA|nr:hypothetical protein [Streptomyces sp. CA-210063]UUU31989.1 hypothetical protein JIX56_19925 [Streptomyces sp. CA-210063]
MRIRSAAIALAISVLALALVLVLALLFALVLAALSDSSGSSDAEPAPDNITGPPVPSTTPIARLSLGEAWGRAVGDDGTSATGRTTALSYQQPAHGVEPLEEGDGTEYEWAKIEAEVCNDKGPSITVSQYPWSLIFADGDRIQIAGGPDFDPQSAKAGFPMDVVVRAGTCVRGKIMFPVTAGQRAERILYEYEGAPGPVEWTVP